MLLCSVGNGRGKEKVPNTYSFRTLEKLKNMTQKEVENFQMVSSLALQYSERYFIFGDDEIINKYNVHFTHLLELEECGLITAQDLSLKLTVAAKKQECIFNSEIVGLIKGESEEIKNISIPVYVFTESGAQLMKAIHPNSNREYIIECLKALRDNNKDLIITAHDINFIDDNGFINYKKADIIPL